MEERDGRDTDSGLGGGARTLAGVVFGTADTSIISVDKSGEVMIG
jgi:hypothetical protein